MTETLGRDVGDVVLQHVADVLCQQLRQGELLARFDGEEFVIVLAQTNLLSASKVAECLLQAVRVAWYCR